MRTVLALTLSLFPAFAAAQYRVEPPSREPTEADIEQARELFMQGAERVEQGRWADAVSAYEESYRLSGIPAALFNTATTLRSMGRHRDARDLFRQVLEVEDLDPETREMAESRMREEAGRVALILLTGLAEAPDARLELDGQTVEGPRADPVELETDPGEHAVSVLREGYAPWREALTLEDGGRQSLRVELTPLRGAELWESPIFWTVLVLVVVGGGVLGGVLAQDAAQLRPREGLGMVVEL
ncbi:MAG: PEGA domain-containing protein [Sandaracinaceae bacterium]|nr:PEGA domain-containing protein [Sandaracinaceae bacterium]